MQFKRRNKQLFKNSNRMSLGQFHAWADDQQLRRQVEAEKVPWRRWHSDGDGGHAEEVDHVPPSTYTLPSQWTHVTHYTALPSIRRTGLDPNRANAKTGLNAASGTSKYVQRDGSLKAVYLGGDEGVGKSMEGEDQTEAGGRVTLHVDMPPEFRYRYLRANRAVISPDKGQFDDHTGGTSAVSFGQIPPEYLSLRHPRTGQKVPLTDLQAGRDGREYDFSPYATQPGNGDRLLSNEDVRRRDEGIRQRLDEAIRAHNAVEPQPPAPTPRAEPSEPRVAMSANSQRAVEDMLGRFQKNNARSSSESDPDSEWED